MKGNLWKGILSIILLIFILYLTFYEPSSKLEDGIIKCIFGIFGLTICYLDSLKGEVLAWDIGPTIKKKEHPSAFLLFLIIWIALYLFVLGWGIYNILF